MPSFDGLPLFGYAVKMETVDATFARQELTFPGLSGVESLRHGFRGRYTSCAGVLQGNTPLQLASWVETFRSYNDGLAYVLVDTLGTTWLEVILDEFRPERGLIHDSVNGYFRRYSAQFRHMI